MKLDRCELDHAKAKPRPALPNHHVRSSLFWDSMQCGVVIHYRRFRTTYHSDIQGSGNPKESFVHCLIF